MRDLRQSKNDKTSQARQEPKQEPRQVPKQEAKQEPKKNKTEQSGATAQRGYQPGTGSGNSQNAEELKRKAQQFGKNVSDSQWRQMQDLQNKAGQYKGKSEGELMAEISKLAKQEKAKGTLNNEQLERFAASVRPMLDAAQQQKLKQILENLK